MLTPRQNTIRKALHRDYYGRLHDDAQLAGFLGAGHVAGCVDALRQALMCAADVGVVVWQWDEDRKRVSPRTDVAHTCRDFDRIRDWGRRNRAVRDFDLNVRVEDGIVIKEIHS